MSKVKLSEFDLYGTFRLTKDETKGIEHLVQELSDDKFLSRNLYYYPRACLKGRLLYFRDHCDQYQQLNAMLPLDGKPAFVICEKMHELATRAANTIQQQNKVHLFQDGEHFDTVAQKCAQECADNLVRLIHGQTAEKTTNLRDETRLRPNDLLGLKVIEADNKKQLYMCANALPDDVEHLITPGRGSSKLGTLVQAVRKQKGLKPLGITQFRYSIYKDSQDKEPFPTIPQNIPENLLVMDDDIDTGRTLGRIKYELTKQGHKVTNGAIFTDFFKLYDNIFDEDDWANYIDIIPNQYATYNSQEDLDYYLSYRNCDTLSHFLNKPRNGNTYKTADYIAMKMAEDKARLLGADLYQVSKKISPAAVTYNKKIRAQVEKYNAEFQASRNV